MSITVDSKGYVYVGDDNLAGAAYVRRYDPNASWTQLGWVRVGGSAGGLAIDGNGNVLDAEGNVGGSVLSIDSAPDPVITPTPASSVTSQNVTFDGSQSGSFSGISSYSWSANGATGTSPTISVQFNTPGTYPITLTVKDRNNQTASTQLNYTVGNSSAAFTNPNSAMTGQNVTFDASASQLPYSSVTDYAWDFDGNSSYSVDSGGSPTVSHAFSAPGIYPVQLRVTRAGGRVDTATGSIVVTPAPPPGQVGVSIDNGAYATNTPNVNLDLVWPAGAGQALISNDGGFGPAGGTRTVPVAPVIPWTLESQGSERLPKTVYVRFPNSSTGDETFTDDIILDTTTPVIHAASVVVRRRGRASDARVASFGVRLRASELISGISGAEFASKRPRHYSSPVRKERDAGAASTSDVVVTFTSVTQRGILNLNRIIGVPMAQQPHYVRVRSAAGTWSSWHRIG